jgi:hypothetical protein
VSRCTRFVSNRHAAATAKHGLLAAALVAITVLVTVYVQVTYLSVLFWRLVLFNLWVACFPLARFCLLAGWYRIAWRSLFVQLLLTLHLF